MRFRLELALAAFLRTKCNSQVTHATVFVFFAPGDEDNGCLELFCLFRYGVFSGVVWNRLWPLVGTR